MVEDKRLDYLIEMSNGNSMWKEEYGIIVCKAFGIPYDKTLYHKQVMDERGLFDSKGNPAEELMGIEELDLLTHIAKELHIDTTSHLTGTLQAEFIAERIAEAIGGSL